MAKKQASPTPTNGKQGLSGPTIGDQLVEQAAAAHVAAIMATAKQDHPQQDLERLEMLIGQMLLEIVTVGIQVRAVRMAMGIEFSNQPAKPRLLIPR